VSWAQQESYLAGSVFRVGLEPREGVALDDLVAGVDAAVDALAGPKPPTAGEIEAAVRIILAQRFRSYESSVARAVFLADVAPFLEGKKPLAFEQARFAAVTPDAVQRVVREYLQKERSVVILSEPPAKVAR
jgi:predicted Zn-dependent peptidase